MTKRRLIAAFLAASIALPGIASAQSWTAGHRATAEKLTDVTRLMKQRSVASAHTPSVGAIMRQLEAVPEVTLRRNERVSVREFKRRPDLRRMAPSIDIQSINFAFGSAEIPYSQYDKVAGIAEALHGILSRRPNAKVLLEGHTDAVGSNRFNFLLSERRAASLRNVLVSEFGVPRRALDTVGYGEEYLLVPTPHESWQNRRVTLRRMDHFVR